MFVWGCCHTVGLYYLLTLSSLKINLRDCSHLFCLASFILFFWGRNKKRQMASNPDSHFMSPACQRHRSCVSRNWEKMQTSCWLHNRLKISVRPTNPVTCLSFYRQSNVLKFCSGTNCDSYSCLTLIKIQGWVRVSVFIHLVVEVRRGRSQDAAVGLEHLSLDMDGEVAEAAVLSLPVQAVQHRGLSAGEANLNHWAAAAAASHLHGHRLHLWGRKTFMTPTAGG